MSHTPGPWTLWGDDRIMADVPEWQAGKEAGLHVIASTAGIGDMRLANARLIAAAPDLLAVCQCVIDCGSSVTPHVWQKAERAFAKATGQEPDAPSP